MLRTVLTLLMAGLQGVIAAPLYVCTSARGDVGLDGGQAMCAVRHSSPTEDQHSGCCSHPDDSAPPAPCDCRHEPLAGDVQQVRRAATMPSGDLLVTALVVSECHLPDQNWDWATCQHAIGRDSLVLTELASVYLRC